MKKPTAKSKHIVLTSHPRGDRQPRPVTWGAANAAARGPVIGSLTRAQDRNVIGAHSGSYAIYRALAISLRLLPTQAFCLQAPSHAITDAMEHDIKVGLRNSHHGTNVRAGNLLDLPEHERQRQSGGRLIQTGENLAFHLSMEQIGLDGLP